MHGEPLRVHTFQPIKEYDTEIGQGIAMLENIQSEFHQSEVETAALPKQRTPMSQISKYKKRRSAGMFAIGDPSSDGEFFESSYHDDNSSYRSDITGDYMSQGKFSGLQTSKLDASEEHRPVSTRPNHYQYEGGNLNAS